MATIVYVHETIRIMKLLNEKYLPRLRPAQVKGLLHSCTYTVTVHRYKY